MGNSIDHYFGARLRGKGYDGQEMSLDILSILQCCQIVLADPEDWFIHETFCKDSLHWWFLTIKFDLCLGYRVLATLTFHQFITVQSVNLKCWNIVDKTGWTKSLMFAKFSSLQLVIPKTCPLISPRHFPLCDQFPSISSSPHIIPCHPLPWDNVQSSAIGIAHVELMQHKAEKFIGVLNSNMGNCIDHYFGAGLRGERWWWSRAVPWYPQDTFPSATISPASLVLPIPSLATVSPATMSKVVQLELFM